MKPHFVILVDLLDIITLKDGWKHNIFVSL